MAPGFSAALCRGLIEAIRIWNLDGTGTGTFSAALCRGLIEAFYATPGEFLAVWGFPRLYAAASLKRYKNLDDLRARIAGFPRLYAAASLKRYKNLDDLRARIAGFPRLYAAASLKQDCVRVLCRLSDDVFRGFMPRPH